MSTAVLNMVVVVLGAVLVTVFMVKILPVAVLELQQIIFDLKASGIGVLITDHNVRETLSVTDRAYIINEGRIFRTGTPGELGRDLDVKRVYLGEGFSLV